MPRDLLETDVFPRPITVPEDGDDQTAASVAEPFLSLANRTTFLRNRVGSLNPTGAGVGLLLRVAGLSELQALSPPDRRDFGFCFVDGFGPYEFLAGSVLPPQPPTVVQPDDIVGAAPGRWIIANQVLLGAANGLATLDANGKIPSSLMPGSGRYMPIDVDDVLVWKLDEDGISLFGNAGSAGQSLANSLVGPSTEGVGVDGVFGSAVYFSGSGRGCLHGAGGTPVIGQRFSVSFWVRVASYGHDLAFLVSKRYREDDSWGPPYVTFAVCLNNSADGKWLVVLKTSSSPNVYTLEISRRIPLGVWTLIAATYDGTTLRAYMNGNRMPESTGASGDIDNGATNGVHMLGGVLSAGAAPYPLEGDLDDVRIARVTRSRDYYQSMYRRAMGGLLEN